MADDDGEQQYELILPDGKKRENGSQNHSGYGNATFANGDTYNGTFVEGQRGGCGVYVHKANGDTYSGHYQSNRKHGFGKMTFTAKSGNEEEDAAEEPEPGKVIRGGVYLGYFSDGQRGISIKDDPAEARSDGTFTYANGDRYVGQWRAGKKHGSGSYIYAKDGTKLIGDWKEGKMASGKWLFPNGTFYTGKFRYNKPYGKGVWVLPNGNQLAGDYKQTEKSTGEEEAPVDVEEGGEAPPKPDPEVYCRFKPEQNTAVYTGFMQCPRPSAAA